MLEQVEQVKQEGGGEGEKVYLTGVDKNGDTPGVQMSDNKEKGTKRQGGTIENELVEGNNQPQIHNMDTSSDIDDNHQASNKGGGRVERNFEEDGSTKETYEMNNQVKKKESNDQISISSSSRYAKEAKK
ncbi:hypothetical protein KY284_000394 [Solanum tuberosum]|nr:hypothetical protein KY284_000394 [Solanum tuberosum]